MKRHVMTAGFLVIILIAVMSSTASGGKGPSGKLLIFHAGSLSIPFSQMEETLEARYPGLDIVREAAGSRKCARKITDDNRVCDLMASADFKVIDNLLIPQHADFNLRFASNQLVLCYTDTSALAKEVNADNWQDILLKKGVNWGHTDPNLDPCGYRALMVLQLAEGHLKNPGLRDKLIGNRPEANVFASAADMVAALKEGKLDYCWEYLSVAVQHELNYLVLPDEINLGNYRHDEGYAGAMVTVTGREPGSTLELKGKSITYGITMLRDAPNKEAAVAFLEYLLDPEGGLKVLKEMGQPPFIPARVPSADMQSRLPKQLQQMVEVK